MSVNVKSEIGVLKRVLLQRPGRELEYLSPNTMDQLLFEDIPYLHGAQREHDCFADLLRSNGVEVVYLEDLAAEALAQSSTLKYDFIRETIHRAGSTALGYQDALYAYLSNLQDLKELVLRTMEGVPFSDVFPNTEAFPMELSQSATRFLIPPMPNLYFTRDPFACIGRGVSINHMHTFARNRETIYGKYIFQYHPDFAGQVPAYYTSAENFSIEGGDILNLSNTVLGVGLSQRTQPEAVKRLAFNIFQDEHSEIDTVLAFRIPQARAFMHLDTVFTQVDVGKFTIHPAILESLRIFELTGKGMGQVRVRELDTSLEDTLKKYLHLDHVELIRCGGDSQIASEREQWNDGANTLCIAPGTVVVYDRNYVTNQLLEDSGINVLKFNGSELSRGRGGPRCMSMPLERLSL